MRALVTGITGFVGGHLVEHLAACGDVVVGLSASGRRSPAVERLARVEAYDLTDPDDDALVDILRRKQPEAIYHLAAQANPRASLDDPRGTWAVNLGGTLNLLEAVRASGLRPRVVLVGTGIAYGNPAPEHIPVREDCPIRPNNPYAASKAAADVLGIQHALTYGTPVVIARPFNHAGPGQSDAYVLSGFARQVAEVELGLRPRIEVGNLDVERDYTDVRDIVRAYRLLAERGEAGEVYNVGTGRGVKLAWALDHLRGLSTRQVEVTVDPARLRAVDLPRLVADAGKLHAAVGWTPSIPIERTLADMLADWRRRLADSADRA